MFIHTHVHTEHSMLDGSGRVDKIIARAKELGQTAIAVTDHGTMSGVIPMYLEAEKQGIKLLVGCEFYINHGNHLIVLAKNETGLKNMYKLHKESYKEENFYSKPNITTNMLFKYSEGLIVTSACLGGEIAKAVMSNKLNEAKRLIQEYKEVFRGDFYLELQTNTMPQQKKYNLTLIDLSKEFNVKTTIACDSHYVKKEDSFAHEILLCMQTKKKLSDEKRFKFYDDSFYIMSEREVKEYVSYLPKDVVLESINNTVEIADKCDVKFDFTETHAPHFNNMNAEQEKHELALKMNEWYKKTYGNIKNQVIIDRIKTELETINLKSYAGYFLIVADYINNFESHTVEIYDQIMHLIVGAGRGSAVGCLVAYALGITKINPLNYGLLFERFLNPERLSYPDIDSDFDYEYRDVAINYVVNKYGVENVSQVAAFGTNAVKKNIRGVLSTFGYEQSAINKIIKTVPAKAKTINDVLACVDFKWYASKMKDREIEVMEALEDIVMVKSKHAAGLIIGDKPLDNYLPLHTISDDRSHFIASLDKYNVARCGLIKHDFLGLKTLSQIRRCLAKIKKNYGIEIDFWNIKKNDEEVYKMLRSGDILGIFQADGDSATEIINKIKPTYFDDIISMEAICRPGVKEAEMFIHNKQHPKDIKKIHPIVDEILESTYGALVFQEQTMLIMNRLTGGKWSLGKADKMRKVKDLDEYKEDFINCCVSNGVASSIATAVFERFSLLYSFNKSHAVAYAYITYGTAFLKTYYRAEWMAEIMTTDEDKSDLITKYIWECKKYNIDILPPDINAQNTDYEEIDGKIRYGLSGIRSIGESVIDEIIITSKEKPIESLSDLYNRVNKRVVNKTKFEALIKAGCFSFQNTNKFKLLNEYYSLRKDKTRIDEIPNEKVFMEYEKEVLGIYLSKHPLDKYFFKAFKDINEGLIGGIINEVKVIDTKKGDKMAFVTLETQDGLVDVVIFPVIYKRYSSALEKKNIVMIKGRKEMRNESYQWVADKVEVIV